MHQCELSRQGLRSLFQSSHYERTYIQNHCKDSICPYLKPNTWSSLLSHQQSSAHITALQQRHSPTCKQRSHTRSPSN